MDQLLRVATLVFGFAISWGMVAQADEERTVPPSVVKIHTTHRYPDPYHPWTKQDATRSSGSGVIIEGNRILTNAHVVQYSTDVLIEAYQSGDKIPAKVQAIAPDIDLAVLTVDEEDFFKKHPPLQRSAVLPKIKDTILVFGFPTGGETLSITRGVVSRIEYAQYYGTTSGLRAQIDAALNPGNSGGPAVVDGKLVGIVFSRLQQSDNIGYIIPNEEIELFLADIADGSYEGKPAMFDVLQLVQNDSLRRRLKLDPSMTGMLVWRPDGTDPSYPLKRWDVISKIGDHPIDNGGMVQAPGDLHVQFIYYIQSLWRDGKVPLQVIRDGKRIKIDLPVLPVHRRPALHPLLLNKYPSYLVWGPLVFSPVSEDHIGAYRQEGMADKWFPYLSFNLSPMLTRYLDKPRFEGEQLVLLVSMLPHRLVKGYSDPASCIVDEVDGTKVRNLQHLAELFRDAKGEFVLISFCDRTADVIALDRKQVAAASEEILMENGIRVPYSEDLKKVFDVKKAEK